MKDRVCVVTGANSGIGLETARELARMGATVVLACRNEQRGARALEDVRTTTSGNAHLALVDLASLASIRAFADDLRGRFPQVHVLVNNAGLWNRKRQVTADGFEATFGVNHLGTFLLTNLLLPSLRGSAASRVVTVSSVAHRFARMQWDDLQSERGYGAQAVYGRSKLANILFTRELARRLEGSGVSANCLHPGLVLTRLWSWVPSVAPLARFVPGVKTPAQGARTSIYLASSPDVEGANGAYFVDCRQATPSSAALDDDAARRLWDVSEQMVGDGAEGAGRAG